MDQEGRTLQVASMSALFTETGRPRRPAILELFRSTCTKCGSTEKPEIHHIDGNHLNNDLANLTILCHNCHRRKDPNLRLSTIAVNIPPELYKAFRGKIIERFGGKKGDVAKAVIEAIELWIKAKS